MVGKHRFGWAFPIPPPHGVLPGTSPLFRPSGLQVSAVGIIWQGWRGVDRQLNQADVGAGQGQGTCVEPLTWSLWEEAGGRGEPHMLIKARQGCGVTPTQEWGSQ